MRGIRAWVLCVALCSGVMCADEVSEILIWQNLTQSLLKQDITQHPLWKPLLHYEGNRSMIGGDSSFFKSPIGYRDPQSEYEAFVDSIYLFELSHMLIQKEDDNKSPLCEYPARIDVLASLLEGEDRQQFIDRVRLKSCTGFQEFREKVIFDEVFLEFAAESDMSPSSAMGHTYLGVNEDNPNAMPYNKKEFAISFFAMESFGINPLPYIRVFLDGVKGYVVVKPMLSFRGDYEFEERALYAFDLDMNAEQKDRLQKHLWELKDKVIPYNFIFYNCNTAIRKILGAARIEFDKGGEKPYQTPREYLTLLEQAGLIKPRHVILPENKRGFIERYGYNEILRAKKNSRLAMSYSGDFKSMGWAKADFSPIYIDGRSVDRAYREFIDTKLAAFRVGANAKKAYIETLDVLSMKSVLDFPSTYSLSKSMRIGLDSNLYQSVSKKHYSTKRNTSSRLLPTFEAGVGMGVYVGGLQGYVLPSVGYRYDVLHNAYMGVEGGVVSSFSAGGYDYKVILSYKYFHDFIADNRGYNHLGYAFLGMSLNPSIDIFLELRSYRHAFNAASRVQDFDYPQKHQLESTAGIAWYF